MSAFCLFLPNCAKKRFMFFKCVYNIFVSLLPQIQFVICVCHILQLLLLLIAASGSHGPQCQFDHPRSIVTPPYFPFPANACCRQEQQKLLGCKKFSIIRIQYEVSPEGFGFRPQCPVSGRTSIHKFYPPRAYKQM